MSSRSLILVWAFVVAAPRFAHAMPDDSEHVQVRTDGRACATRGGLCFHAAGTTLAAATPSASLRATAPTPTFARLPTTGNTDQEKWTLDVDAHLRRSAWAGNCVFLFYDADDADALAHHEVTALYQAPIAAGSAVDIRVALDPDDGFRAGHTYLLRVAQLIDGKEIVLAEGQLVLQ